MMDRSRLGSWFVPCLMVAACASTPPPAQPSPSGSRGGEVAHHGPGAAHHGPGATHHGPSFPPGPVAEMWDALRPLTHGRAGSVPAERDARICAQVEVLRQRASAMAAAPVPAGAEARADAWRAGTARLTREADALATACADPTRAGAYERVEAMHVAFHDITADLSP